MRSLLNLLVPKKRRLKICMQNRHNGSCSFISDGVTRKQFLKNMAEWWDSQGTNFNDYDSIKIETEEECDSSI